MVPLTSLWLPILLSTVIVFVASSIMHTLLPYHRGDYRQLPDEDKLLAAMRAAGLNRGLYIFPFSGHKDMKSVALREKYQQGPVGMMTIFPSGLPVMPRFLGMWFAYCLILGIAVAYLTGHTVAPGASYPAVLRVAGTAAFLAYGLGQLSNSVWKGQTWSVTSKEVIDGFVYALLTAALLAGFGPVSVRPPGRISHPLAELTI
jgi:hypothetical protein